MKLSIDKCSKFGIAKHSGKFTQFLPSLFVFARALSVIQLGCGFKYLGGIYSYNLDNQIAKNDLVISQAY